jgi:hypothetical protein
MMSDPIPLSSLRLLLPVLVSIEGNYLRVCMGTNCEQVSHYFIDPPEEECD